jgi:ribosomal protein S18 acetylase RimI-like enzyme
MEPSETEEPAADPPVADEGAMVVPIRAAREADLAEVLRLWRRASAEPSHTDDVGSLAGLLAHDPGALLVADGGGGLVGSVIAGWDGWRGSVYRLVVAPSHRRTGLGRRLVTEAEGRLSERGAVRMQAIVVQTHGPAVGFWRASGWEEQVERLRFVLG